MISYPDVGYLLSVLIKGEETGRASRILRQLGVPQPINGCHRLQIENGIFRALYRADKKASAMAADALRTWRSYLLEGVFQIGAVDYDAGFRLAASWHLELIDQPPPWAIALHPALAVASGASHFLSFDVRARKLAKNAGLLLLPEHL
jgi:hypothetical protein